MMRYAAATLFGFFMVLVCVDCRPPWPTEDINFIGTKPTVTECKAGCAHIARMAGADGYAMCDEFRADYVDGETFPCWVLCVGSGAANRGPHEPHWQPQCWLRYRTCNEIGAHCTPSGHDDEL